MDDPAIWVGGFCGAICWLLCFWKLPKPMWVYVAGHELTHALAALLCGAVPRSIKIKSSGGRVELPRTNTFITLAPYLVPLYALIWSLIVWSIHETLRVRVSPFWVSYGLGLTYAFHVTLTGYVLRVRQPDFMAEGEFLSLVLTILGNLIFVLIVLGCLGSRLSVGGELTAWGRETLIGIRWVARTIFRF